MLGCGTSTGVPRIGNDWGECDPTEPKNRRSRVSIIVESEASPDDLAYLDLLVTREEALALGYEQGAQVWYENADFGVAGWADVTRVEPIPIEAGAGCLVTTTIQSENGRLVRVVFEDAPELVTTDAHPLWSETRGAWIEAFELWPGELVTTSTGSVEVAWVERLPGVHPVHNLEVEGAHHYYAGDVQALVHNGCDDGPQFGGSASIWRRIGAALERLSLPARLGLRSIAENADDLRAFNNVLRQAARSRRDNDYRRWLRAVERQARGGAAVTPDENLAAFNYVRRRFFAATGRTGEGYAIHHWMPKADHPQYILDPRNLYVLTDRYVSVPGRVQDMRVGEHITVHQLVQGGTSGPMAPGSELDLGPPMNVLDP